MTATVQIALDTAQAAAIEARLAEANRRLARSREAPDDVRALVRELADGMTDLDGDSLGHADPYLVVALQAAALGALRALEHDDPAEARRRLRLRLEQMRQVFRDLASGQPLAEDRPAKDVARWLVATVDVSQRRLADLLGVRERTFQRWISEAEPSRPEGDDARRLRIVARIAAHLRHTLTGPGVVRWFERPRDELGGKTPAALLDDPDAVGRLLALASGARSSAAA
jgi:DNA-binding transcriptional regulator YiaG